MMNRNRAKANLSPIDNNKPRTCEIGPREKKRCSARLAVQPCGFSTAPWFWRRGENPHRWKCRRAGVRALRYPVLEAC
jgi:hypothetical protein